MPNTSGGTPYVDSSDLVAAYPTTSLALANKVDTKIDYALPVNAQTGTTYTFVLADGLRLTTASNGSPQTFTIPPQSSVTWLANTVIRVVNYGAGALTVNGGSGVTVTNTATTIPQYGSAAAIRTASDAWTLVPFGGGANNADFSNTATGTYTAAGISYKYVTFTSNATLTVTKSGWAEVLVTGGGGGGGSSFGGGGGAGAIMWGARFLEAGSITVVCGAGGTSPGGGSGQGGDGGHSRLGPEVGHTNIAFGGGGGGGGTGAGAAGRNGACGGGGGSDNTSGAAGSALALQGYNGSAGQSLQPGGCGGGIGGSPPARTTAGPGVSFSITGSSVVYGCGGAGESSTAATGYVAGANGNGGNGRAVGSPGTIIVRVRV